MASQELIDYVKERRGEGFSDDNIRTVLLNAGYDRNTIEESIVAAGTVASPAGQATVGASASPQPITVTSTVQQSPKGNSKKIAVFSIIVLILLLGAGTAFAYFYYFNPSLTSDLVLQKMYENAPNIKTLAFSGNFTATIYPQASFTSSTLAALPAGVVAGLPTSTVTSAMFSGESDMTDLSNIKQSSTVSVSGGIGSQGFQTTVSLVSIGHVYYVKLGSFDLGLPAAEDPFSSILAAFIGQWYEIDPVALAQTFGGAQTSQILQAESSTQFTAATIQKLRDAALQANIVSVSQVLPDETIDGQSDYHYKLAVNGKNLQNFLATAASILSSSGNNSSSTLTDEELQNFQTAFSAFRLNDLEIWIGTNDFLPYKISADVSEISQSSTIADVVVQEESNNFNQPITISAPAGAKDIMTLLSGFAAGLPGTPSSLSGGSSANNAELSEESRDGERISDLAVLKSAVSYYLASGGTFASCKQGKVYSSNQGTAAVDGTGWLPINLDSLAQGSPLAELPKDPINAGKEVYTFVCDPNTLTFKLTAMMESKKYGLGGTSDVVSTDGGINPDLYEQGTNLSL